MTEQTKPRRSRKRKVAKRPAPHTMNDPVLALAQYWISADYMHTLTHILNEKWDVSAASRKKHWQEFRTYHAYWLSALYVVVEGFIELKFDATKVPEITHPHIKNLKLFRNGCFHYQRDTRKQIKFFDPEPFESMNWAERLHNQLRHFFLDYTAASGA